VTSNLHDAPDNVENYLSAVLEIVWQGDRWIGRPRLDPFNRGQATNFPEFGFGICVVLTACNPMGENYTGQENAANIGLLSAALSEKDLAWLPCLGRDADSQHIEESFLVQNVDSGELIQLEALALEIRQEALLIFEESDRVLRCSNRFRPDIRQNFQWSIAR
jgi:hypothetical protein